MTLYDKIDLFSLDNNSSSEERNRLKEKIKEQLKKDKSYITHGQIKARLGGKTIVIPIRGLRQPKWRYGKHSIGGVGSGDGQPGDVIGQDKADGQQAGDQPGEHALEVEVSREELARWLQKDLELPNVQLKPGKNIMGEKEVYNSRRRRGPNCLLDKKATMRQIYKRNIASGKFKAQPGEQSEQGSVVRGKPRLDFIEDDKRFKDYTIRNEHENAAVVFQLLDVSGSMGYDQRELARRHAWWVETFLMSQYKGIDFVYILHDVHAKVVDEYKFYNIAESGGTMVSSAFKKTYEIVKTKYKPEDYNIYIFDYSDGDNWGDDNKDLLAVINNDLMPIVNLLAYVQIESQWGTGELKKTLDEGVIVRKGMNNYSSSHIKSIDDIADSLKIHLGKGR